MIADLMAEPLLGGLSPGLVLILGAVVAPLLPDRVRQVYMLALPVLAFVQLLGLPIGVSGQIPLFGSELTTVRVDRLSLIFGYVFLLAAFLGVLYALHIRDRLQETAALIYAGSAVGAVFAGDLITLFLFWEGTAIASVFLIWASGTDRAVAAGQRYLIMQVGSGVLLLAGIMIHFGQTGSIAFDSFSPETLAGGLIFIAFGIKCAFPFLHTWLKDAYPEGTVTGTVILSAFTTKLAVYALARGYAGTEVLIPIGTVMAAFPMFFAVIENDLRRVLAYSLNSGLGFMVVGIGIGTELAVSGAAAYAFCSVLYVALLYMSTGAVLLRTGTANATGLGGLHRTMPWTSAFCCIGAASASAFPLFSGFVSKSLILSSAMKEGHLVPWIVLMCATVGVFHNSGLKVPFFAFYGRDSGLRPKEAPLNMLVAMGITAALCIAIGVLPTRLYSILPYDVTYHSYTLEHVITQLQLLVLAAIAFALMMRTGFYPAEMRATNLDVDWFWRRPIKALAWGTLSSVLRGWAALGQQGLRASGRIARGLYRQHGPTGTLARTRPSGSMALWMAMMLVIFLVFSFF